MPFHLHVFLFFFGSNIVYIYSFVTIKNAIFLYIFFLKVISYGHCFVAKKDVIISCIKHVYEPVSVKTGLNDIK